jgi:hypothetical protein
MNAFEGYRALGRNRPTPSGVLIKEEYKNQVGA